MIHLYKKNLFIIIYEVLALIVAYVPFIFKLILPVNKYLFNPIIMLIIIILAIMGIIYILKYKYYFKAFNEANKLSELFSDEHTLNEAKFADVEINEKEFKDLELNSKLYTDKEGYEYLNAIFFKRHKRLLYKPMYIELIIITIIFLAGLVVQIIFPNSMNKLLGEINKAILGLLLIMYLISNSRRITRAMFYNCDISFLRYGFYRNKNVILNNFINILPIVFMILILSLFFSVQDLFLYDIMQPYTIELNIKNPFFNIINGVIFWICYLSSKIKTTPTYFVGIVLIITIVYIIIALYLVYKYSEKTFKVK